jgi:hypothetical protein
MKYLEEWIEEEPMSFANEPTPEFELRHRLAHTAIQDEVEFRDLIEDRDDEDQLVDLRITVVPGATGHARRSSRKR